MATRSAALGARSRPSRYSWNIQGFMRAPLQPPRVARTAQHGTQAGLGQNNPAQARKSEPPSQARASQPASQPATQLPARPSHLPTITARQPWLSMRRLAS